MKSGFHKRRRLKHSEAADDAAKADDDSLKVSLEELTSLFRTRWRLVFSFLSSSNSRAGSSSEILSSMLLAFSSLVLSRILHAIVQETVNNILLCKTQALLRATQVANREIESLSASLRSCQHKLVEANRVQEWLDRLSGGGFGTNLSAFAALSLVDGSCYDNQKLQVW